MHLSAQKIIDYCYAILSNSQYNVDNNMETDTGDTVEDTEEEEEEELDQTRPDQLTSFIVVECKRAINQHHHRVCVPRTWITCPMRGLKVAIGYPTEDEDTIAQRVRNKEPVDKNWQPHIGEIQFESESYEDAVAYLQAICAGSSEQIEDNSNQKSYEGAGGHLQANGEGTSEQIEDNSNEKSYQDAASEHIEDKSNEGIEDNGNEDPIEEAVAYFETICGENSEQTEDNSNEEHSEDDMDGLPALCLENRQQIEDNSNEKPNEDAIDDLQEVCGDNSELIEDNSNTIKAITEPENPLKLRICNFRPKLYQKPEKKKKSDKKLHKKHRKEYSKHKVRKSKRRYMEQLSDNSSERNSLDSSDTWVDTESCHRQSNCQSSESSPKSRESESVNSVDTVPETHLIINKYKQNNNNYSYPSKRKIESVDAEKENNDDMLFEDQQFVDNMYMNIMRHVQFMETTALEMKKSHLIAMKNTKILDKLAAKYRIPLHVTDSVERENERKGGPFEEEIMQDDEMETQDDNEAQVAEESDNTSEENLLEERAERMQESESDSQTYTGCESSEDYVPSSQEVVKYKRKADIRTLKHPRPGKGLIPIVRNSGIYISAKRLEIAKCTSKDVLQFARAVFKEVFTPYALRTHSMTGYTRTALPFEFTRILKDYVMQYGQDVGWVSVKSQDLEYNLSRMLNNCRRSILRRKTLKGS